MGPSRQAATSRPVKHQGANAKNNRFLPCRQVSFRTKFCVQGSARSAQHIKHTIGRHRCQFAASGRIAVNQPSFETSSSYRQKRHPCQPGRTSMLSVPHLTRQAGAFPDAISPCQRNACQPHGQEPQPHGQDPQIPPSPTRFVGPRLRTVFIKTVLGKKLVCCPCVLLDLGAHSLSHKLGVNSRVLPA